MARCRDLMMPSLVTAHRSATMHDLAQLMTTSDVGAVVIMEGETVEGIVTEQDFVRLAATGGDPARERAEAHMSREVVSIDPAKDAAEAALAMVDLGISHLPVVEQGHAIGMVALRDLVEWSSAIATSEPRDRTQEIRRAVHYDITRRI